MKKAWAIFVRSNKTDILIAISDTKPTVDKLAKIAARDLDPNDITIRWDDIKKDVPDMVDCRIWSNGNPNHVFAKAIDMISL